MIRHRSSFQESRVLVLLLPKPALEAVICSCYEFGMLFSCSLLEPICSLAYCNICWKNIFCIKILLIAISRA